MSLRDRLRIMLRQREAFWSAVSHMLCCEPPDKVAAFLEEQAAIIRKQGGLIPIEKLR